MKVEATATSSSKPSVGATVVPVTEPPVAKTPVTQTPVTQTPVVELLPLAPTHLCPWRQAERVTASHGLNESRLA